MAQQEEGWPLGLRLLNGRVGMVREGDLSGSLSLTTVLTASPTHSTGSSSDLDTQSIGSFFHDRSITLGSLLGISTFLELSRRSSTREVVLETSRDNKKNHKLIKPWLFSLCSKLTTDAINVNDRAPSLGQYLVAERRTASSYRRNQCGLSPVQESNSPFVGAQVGVSSPGLLLGEDGGRREGNRALEQNNEHGIPILFSCLCG